MKQTKIIKGSQEVINDSEQTTKENFNNLKFTAPSFQIPKEKQFHVKHKYKTQIPKFHSMVKNS